jgi:D-proline reductase (dithiol) PrdB
VDTIERIDKWRARYDEWFGIYGRELLRGDVDTDYPFIRNKNAPFVPLRRALPLLNLALVTSAGAYLDGTDSFDTNAPGGDTSFREIPTLIEAEDLQYAARGYDPAAVRSDMNSQIPLKRLFEFTSNGIIGGLTPVFWSFCGFIPDAARLVEDSLPRLVERIERYAPNAVLLIPASRLCHQSMSLAARAIEASGIPTMTLGVERDITDGVLAPRATYYDGEFGSVAGAPNWPEHQRRVLDESLRLLEPIDQPGTRKLSVTLETEVEQSRGEK